LIILLFSLLKPTIFRIEYELNLQAYRDILSGRYTRFYFNSLRLAAVTTLSCLVLGYPAAYFTARSSEKVKGILLILIIIPFWTNFIIRVFAWRIILSPQGVVNSMLKYLHLLDQPLRILRTDLAVILVMVYVSLPYMILPLYSIIEKIDFTLLDAAEDLGANQWKAFYKITLPLSKEGIMAGTILVFIPSLGAYLVPQIMGSQDSLYIGQIITYKVMNIPKNWPIASALSFILLISIFFLLTTSYIVYEKVVKTKGINEGRWS
jgi:spermidine/putrescine transport system permease protein